MKLFLLAALVAVAIASEQAPRPYDPAPNAFAASIAASNAANEGRINDINAARQHGVNRKALHYGAGVGTAPYYGVPGTSVKGVHNDGYYGGYNNRAYGYGYNGGYGHGYNGAYNAPYGYGHHGAYDGVYGYANAGH